MKDYDIIKQIVYKFFSKEKFVFLSALIAGIVSHFMLLIYDITCQDGIMQGPFIKTGLFETSIGRWGILLIDRFRLGFVFYSFLTIISIVIVAFIAVAINRLFDIESKVVSLLNSICIAAFPVITVTFIYQYTAYLYVISILSAVLSIIMIYKVKNNIWGGGIFKFICYDFFIYISG